MLEMWEPQETPGRFAHDVVVFGFGYIRHQLFGDVGEWSVTGFPEDPREVACPHETLRSEAVEQYLMPASDITIGIRFSAERILAGQMCHDVLVAVEAVGGMAHRVVP